MGLTVATFEIIKHMVMVCLQTKKVQYIMDFLNSVIQQLKEFKHTKMGVFIKDSFKMEKDTVKESIETHMLFIMDHFEMGSLMVMEY